MVLRMRILYAALLLLALSAAAPAGAAERRYSVTGFDKVQVDGPYEVRIVTGAAPGARAVGDQAAIDRVSVEVQGQTLRIRNNRNAWGGYPGDVHGIVVIEASTHELRAASVVGSGSLAIDRAKGLRVELSISGSGRLSLAAADADTLVAGVLGSGRMTLAGKAKQLRAAVQGTGDLDGRALNADDADITADTAGLIAVGVLRTAKVNASGAGDVQVIGHADCTLSGLGASRVRCGD